MESSGLAADLAIGRGHPAARIRVEVEVSSAGRHLVVEISHTAYAVETGFTRRRPQHALVQFGGCARADAWARDAF